MKLMGGGAALMAKELRQTVSVIAGVWCALVGYLVFRWFQSEMLGAPGRLTVGQVLYWSALAGMGAMGSMFLAYENNTGTANFLLRLPVARSKIFFVKIVSHLIGLVLLVGVGLGVVFAFAVQAGIVWKLPSFYLYHDLYEAVLWFPLLYFLTVCCSVYSDRPITVFVPAVACGAIIYVASLVVGLCIVGLFDLGAPYSPGVDPSEVDFGLAEVVSCVELTCLLPFITGLAWWRFSRKEGR